MALDPHLDARQLQELAGSRPDLWDEIVQHPQCYPQLNEWITSQRQAHESSDHASNSSTALPVADAPDVHHPLASSTTPSIPAKSSRTPVIVIGVLITIIVILALVLAGIATFKLRHSEPAYAYGVVKVDEAPLPEKSVVLASRVSPDGQSVYSLVVRQKVDESQEFETTLIRTTPGSDVVEETVVPLEETAVFTDPLAELCHLGFDSDCSHQIDESTIEYVGFGTFTWDENRSVWTHNDVAYSTDVILGVVGETVFGSRTARGIEGSAATGVAVVEDVTAFDRQTGSERWTYKLEKPGFVSVDANGLVVVEGITLPAEVREYFATTEYSARDVTALFTELGERTDRYYRLTPASSEKEAEIVTNPQSSVQITTSIFGPAPDAIRSFDYMNTFYPFAADAGCPGFDEQRSDGYQSVTPLPTQSERCWDLVENGRGNYSFGDFAPGTPARQSVESMGLVPGTHVAQDTALFTDVNADGYEDLIVFSRLGYLDIVGGDMNVFIFNPEDPERPLVYSYMSGPGFPGMEFWVEDGLVKFGLNGCAMVDLRFEGTGSEVTVTRVRGIEDYLQCN